MLVSQIIYADEVPQALRDFLGDENTRFCGVATNNDVKMLSYYNIVILGAHDLPQVICNPICNYPPSLNVCLMHTLGPIFQRRDPI
jgi:hypothetical protein